MNMTRKSNIELLRIISMLLVLVVHASFLALDCPSRELIISSPFSAFMRCFSESISIVCVNAFILISGWFGIRTKTSRLVELAFQVFFFFVLVPIILYFVNLPLDKSIGEYCRLFIFCDEMWFVRAYIILLLFSPLLNIFVEHSSKQQLKLFLISFYIVQTLLSHKVNWFSGGYSPLSFMGLYLLARYMRIYPSVYTSLRKSFDMIIYVGGVLFITIFAVLVVYLQIADIGTLYTYSSPIVVISSVYFFLFFSKLSFTSRIVNWVAASAFSIYLFHCNPLFLKPIYLKFIRDWYSLDGGLFICYVVAFLSLVFVISILSDKLRMIIWNYVLSKFK